MRPARPLAIAAALCLLPAAAQASPSSEAVPGITSAVGGLSPAGSGGMWVSQPNNAGSVVRATGGGIQQAYLGGAVTNLPAGLGPTQLTTTPDGAAWFLLNGLSGEWGRVDPTTGAVSRYALPFATPTSIAADASGQVWMTADADLPLVPDSVVRYDPASNTATFFTGGFAAGSNPRSMLRGDDSAMWFVEAAGSGRVGRVASSGSISFRTVGGAPSGLGNVGASAPWFTRGTVVGDLSSDPPGLLDTGSVANLITAGPDGAIWAAGTGRVIRLVRGGGIATYSAGIPGSAQSTALAVGADRRLWVGLDRSPFLVRISVPPLVTNVTAAPASSTTATLTATVNPNGQPTSGRVEYRPTSSSTWTSLTETDLGSGTVASPIQFDVTGLPPAQELELRLVTTNTAGAESTSRVVQMPGAQPTPTPVPTPTPTPTPDPTPTPTRRRRRSPRRLRRPSPWRRRSPCRHCRRPTRHHRRPRRRRPRRLSRRRPQSRRRLQSRPRPRLRLRLRHRLRPKALPRPRPLVRRRRPRR